MAAKQNTDANFEGWVGLDPKAVGNMVWRSFEPKPWEETDVDIRVEYSGICGSDLHTLRSGWSRSPYPIVVGHEIVGRAVRIGSSLAPSHPLSRLPLGTRVGVGAQASSCLRPDCAECTAHLEQHCARQVSTYASKYPSGAVSMGGHALHARVPAHFVFVIPPKLAPELAAPMLCGGVTVYSPLKRFGCGPGVRVGVVGLGGLGHFAVLFAKALGAASVTVVSRSRAKEEDARKMGADNFVATEEEGWYKKAAGSVDLLVCTVSGAGMPLARYLRLLGTRGTFVLVGVPEEQVPGFHAFGLIAKGLRMAGSAIGSPDEIREMLDLAAESGVRPWVQRRGMAEANQALLDLEEGRARYRYVLVNEGVEGETKL